MSSSPFLLFTALFFAMAAQAASSDEPRMNGEAVPPAAAAYPTLPDFRLPEPGSSTEWGNRAGTRQYPRGDARYGTGYEARQGLGARNERDRGR